MSTKTEKKENIRHEIIESAIVYSQELAGKTFLYVFKDEYFELYFPVDRFLHLTGVKSVLSAKNFYKSAKRRLLTDRQFYFDSRYPYDNARKKLPCIIRLSELTRNIVCVLKDLKTYSITYKLSLTNLEFTLGLTENKDDNGNLINKLMVPMTLRVEDSSVEKSSGGEIVDFIFCKDSSHNLYDTIMFIDKTKKIPDSIVDMLANNIKEEFNL